MDITKGRKNTEIGKYVTKYKGYFILLFNLFKI